MAIKFNKEAKEVIVKSFAEAKTYEALKQAFIEAMKQYPTKSAHAFIEEAFDNVVEAVKDVHVSMEGKMYKKDMKEDPAEFKAIIATLLNVEGLTIEQCGTWLWIGGNTKDNKALLKQAGFSFSGKKKMWYKKPEGTGYRRSKGWDMNKIRDTYGSIKIEDAEEVAE